MTAQEISRAIWLALAFFGIVISFCTLVNALQDYRVVSRLPRPNGRKLVAQILARDELMSLFVQVGFFAIVVSAIVSPGLSPARNIAFAIISLVLGFNSFCRYMDRREFDARRTEDHANAGES